MLMLDMSKKIGQKVNDRVPDVTQLFARELKMDLSKEDIEARVANYFIAFNRLVENNGLSGMLGRGKVTSDDDRQRMKLRCKLLLANVTPEILKIDLSRLVDFNHRDANVNDRALYDLTIERATRQQRYHLIQAEMKQNTVSKVKETTVKAGKAGVAKTLREKRDHVPFCPDTGSDANIIGQPVFDELRDLIPSLPIERVEPPVQVIAAGGNTMSCREKIPIDLQIVTAAGPLALTNIACLELDAPEEEL
ncbi:uncharacterized protein IUM83_13072 [Phytophthora cinnamomi]|uniref:uncharacterized protein n=1 Tax=Phytophthora cinnamomi TaxID=4785 RepID=UPI00355971DE|nr:hypothetical protein IUM83_13072 [Phytophthora cinnamomi]